MEKYIVENILDSDEESPEEDSLPFAAFSPPRRPALLSRQEQEVHHQLFRNDRALSIPVMSSSLP